MPSIIVRSMKKSKHMNFGVFIYYTKQNSQISYKLKLINRFFIIYSLRQLLATRGTANFNNCRIFPDDINSLV